MGIRCSRPTPSTESDIQAASDTDHALPDSAHVRVPPPLIYLAGFVVALPLQIAARFPGLPLIPALVISIVALALGLPDRGSR
jgi:hypothetical protein